MCNGCLINFARENRKCSSCHLVPDIAVLVLSFLNHVQFLVVVYGGYVGLYFTLCVVTTSGWKTLPRHPDYPISSQVSVQVKRTIPSILCCMLDGTKIFGGGGEWQYKFNQQQFVYLDNAIKFSSQDALTYHISDVRQIAQLSKTLWLTSGLGNLELVS